MSEPSHDPAPSRQVLPGGETIEIDGSTVADPETGRPIPAAVLRLPAWRLRELAAALEAWTATHALLTATCTCPLSSTYPGP